MKLHQNILSIFVIFLSIIFLTTSANAIEISADTTAYDLSSLGLPAVKAGKVTQAPRVDGVIAPGEYPSGISLSFGKEISLMSSAGNLDYTTEAGKTVLTGLSRISEFQEELFVAFDDTMCYLAVRAKAPGNQIISPVTLNSNERSIALRFSVGLSQSEKLYESTSAWNCLYFFRENVCAAAEGEVILVSSSGNSVNRKFGNTVLTSGKSYTDENGFLWDGAGYASRAAYSLSTEGEYTLLVAECSVPLEEVLLSAPVSERDAIRQALRNGNSTVHGCVSTELMIPGQLPSTSGALAQAMLVTGAASGSISGYHPLPDVVRLPLYWVGEPPAAVLPPNPGTDGSPNEQTGSISGEGTDSNSGVQNSGNPGGSAAWGDGSAHADLPTVNVEGDVDPEWSGEGLLPDEFIYPTTGGDYLEYEETEDKSSNFSAFLGIIAALLLALTALFFMLAIRADERRAMLRMKEDAAAVQKEREKQKVAVMKRPVRKRKRR